MVAAPASRLESPLYVAVTGNAPSCDQVVRQCANPAASSGTLGHRGMPSNAIVPVGLRAVTLALTSTGWPICAGVDEIAVFAAPAGAAVVQLISAAEAPLAEKQAAPVIERFLAGRKRLELAAAEARRLRERARIEYVGDFNAR